MTRAQLVSQGSDNWLSSRSRAAEHSNTSSMARAQLVGRVVNEHIMLFADRSLLIPLRSSVAAHRSLPIARFSSLFACCSISSPTVVYLLQPTLIDPRTVSHCNGDLCSPDTDSQPVGRPHESPECPGLHAHHRQREIETKTTSPSETGETRFR
ncbi:hypothetical protein BDW60DRAFT_202076 [Aspergillus nidulans var. acristatus]